MPEVLPPYAESKKIRLHPPGFVEKEKDKFHVQQPVKKKTFHCDVENPLGIVRKWLKTATCQHFQQGFQHVEISFRFTTGITGCRRQEKKFLLHFTSFCAFGKVPVCQNSSGGQLVRRQKLGFKQWQNAAYGVIL